MKKIFMLMAVLALVFCFSGCSGLETDTESLMKPPLLSEEQEKLNAALTEVAGENYTLKYPKTGEMNSAFIFRDLDGDGTDEAMAFYSSVDESTRINVLKREKENWISVYEAAGFSGDIESAVFEKINEKNDVLIVRWENETGVYRFNKNRMETVYTSECDGEEIVDINGDGFKDIIFFKGNAMGRSFVNVLYCGEDGITVTEEINAHAQYDSIFSAASGKIDESRTVYFIDSEIYEGVYLTEIIALENGKAERYTIADFVEDEKKENTIEGSSGVIIIVGSNLGKRGIFLRNTKVPCMDIDGDGIIEMPVEVREDYASEKTDIIYYLQYVKLSGEKAVPVWNGIANSQSGYLFTLPENWNDKIGISFNSADNEMLFVNKDDGKVVMKICEADKSDYQDEYEDYVLAAESETKNYYVKSFTEPENEFYIDPETFDECFIFI